MQIRFHVTGEVFNSLATFPWQRQRQRSKAKKLGNCKYPLYPSGHPTKHSCQFQFLCLCRVTFEWMSISCGTFVLCHFALVFSDTFGSRLFAMPLLSG